MGSRIPANEEPPRDLRIGKTVPISRSVTCSRCVRCRMDRHIGDKPAVAAFSRALRQDVAINHLDTSVRAENGAADHGRTVKRLEDVENAAAVAGRVPGAREAVAHFEVAGS